MPSFNTCMTLHYFIGLFGIQDTCNHYSKIKIADSAQPRKVVRGCGLDTRLFYHVKVDRKWVGSIAKKMKPFLGVLEV